MQCNILDYQTTKPNEQSNICAHMIIPTNDTTTMHENMQYNIIDNGTKLIDSDKPHRPDSFLNDSDKSYRPVSLLTRVEVQNV